MKLVQFVDGKYGIRKFSLFHLGWVFKSLNTGYFWPPDSEYFPLCKGTKEKCLSMMNDHKVVK